MTKLIKEIIKLGSIGLSFCQKLGHSGLFLIQTLIRPPRFKKTFPLFVQQLYAIGVLSFIIIAVSGLFIGMVLALQGEQVLSDFGATAQLGQLVALSVVRELGPVVTALLFAGRAGTSLTSEIGLMRATEQLSSMEMMAVDPLERVVYPRFLAGFVSMPLLSIIFSAIAIGGGYFVGVQWLHVDAGSFWGNMQASVNFTHDVLSGVIKSVVFGFFVTWIAVFQGYYCQPNAVGISRATTKTVVYASLMVLALDFILTAVMMN